MGSSRERRRGQAVTRRPRGPLGWAVQIVGELLITAGLIVVLFVVWQLWWTNIAAGQAQSEAVQSMKDSFQHASPLPPPEEGKEGEPPVRQAPEHGGPIGIVYIPRFGEDYERPVIQGTGSDVLDTLGLGHYAHSAMPGQVGNFAVAGHRQTNGKVLDQIDKLVAGEKIYVQTADGFYTYTFRNNEIVLPSEVSAIAPVPGHPGQEPKDRIMTLTSCNPRFGAQERIIAYAVMDGWQPNSAGPPAEIAHVVGKG